MQMRRLRGSRTVMSFRLCSRAPWTTSSSAAIRGPLYPPNMCSGRGFGATPTVRVAGLGEACLDRVVEDVVARGREVLVFPDHARAEAFAEQVAASPVAEVDPRRVPSAQVLDAGGESRLRRVDDDVVVVRHQAEDVDLPLVAVDG